MGFFEDDRIRSKNKLHQAASDYYSKLSAEGLSDEAISSLMKDLIKTDDNNPRNDIYSLVLKIVDRTDNEEVLTKVSTDSSNSDS